MAKPTHFLLLLLLPLFTYTFATAAPAASPAKAPAAAPAKTPAAPAGAPAGASAAENFIKCLAEQNIPQEQVTKITFLPSNPSFPTVLQNYIRNARFNISITPKPLLIVTPLEDSHVQATVVCAKKLGMHLKTRSGGHDYEGISYVSDVPFFILDMFNMRSITVDAAAAVATVQCGATLGELYHKIWETTKAHGFPAGVCPTVGVGGHLSGGGYGNLMRKYGMSIDNVIDAKMVDVNGKVLDRTGMGEDLFWAIIGGGGGSFGVILSYTVKLVPVPEVVTIFRVEKTLEQDATAMVFKFQQVAPVTDPDLFLRLLLQPIKENNVGTVRASVLAMFLGDAARLLSITDKEFPELGLKKEDCTEMSWIQSVLWWGNFEVNSTTPDALTNREPDKKIGFLKRKSDYIQTPINPEGLEALWKKMMELGKIGLVFNTMGGKMAEIPATDTPFPHRAGNLFKVQYSINWKEENATEASLAQATSLYEYMTPLVAKNPRGAFLNYRDLDIGINHHGPKSLEEGKVYGDMYFGQNFDRLVKVKTAVDPENFFRHEQSIPVGPK